MQCLKVRVSLISAIYVLCAQSILCVQGSLLDFPLLTGGYDIGDYLATHHNSENPWIVSTIPNPHLIDQHFLPTINVDYSTLDTSTNHLGNVNHIKNQFGNTFIPSTVDKALNSLLNSDAILSPKTTPLLHIPNHDGDKCIDHIHSVDVVATHKPFGSYKKQTITSVPRPINLNVAPHSIYVPISHAHIYPVPGSIVKPTTIKEITGPILKQLPYYTDKFTLPYRRSDKSHVVHKKTPFVINFPTLKSVVFHRTN